MRRRPFVVKRIGGSGEARGGSKGVFAFNRRFETDGLEFFEQSTSRQLQAQTGKHDDFNPPRGFERENFVAENSTTQPQHERTQSAPNSMNNPNPFVPKGSLLEQQSKRHSRVKFAVFCVLAVGITSLTTMLIQGCKREQTETENTAPTVETNLSPTVETNLPQVEASNPTVQPPLAVVPPAVTETAAAEYVVVKGDTLAKIAKKNGVTLKALQAANPGVEPAKLKVGQKLSVPASSSAAAPAVSVGASGGEGIYTVKSGDTLTKVAKAHGTTVKAIESENNLTTTKIKVGQKLKIPAKAEALAPAAPVSSAPAMPPQGTTPVPARAPSGQ